MIDAVKKVPCTLCAAPTDYTGTKLCNRCWELNTRVRNDPDIAQDILNNLEREIKE